MSDKVLDDIPQGFDHADGTLAKVDKWIFLGHPDKCVPRLRHILSESKISYLTAAQRLTVHCTREHGEGIQALTQLYRYYFPTHPEEIGLADAIRATQTRLVDEIRVEWESVDRTGRNALQVVAGYLDDDLFQQLWNATWTDGLADKNPQAAAAVFAASAFSPSKASYAVSQIKRSLPTLSNLILDDLILCLVLSKELRSLRDDVLHHLINLKGTTAAKSIINNSQAATDIGPCVALATRTILDSEPEDPAIPIGIGLCLNIDPDFAIPVIVDWVNTGRSNQHYDHTLRWKIEQSNQRELFRALASDAIKRNPIWHRTLAQLHHDLITQAQHAVEWIAETFDNERTLTYNASLLVEYLSEPISATQKTIETLREYAHQLHGKYGSENEKKVLADASLADSKLPHFDDLVAIAFAKNILFPSMQVNGKKVLETLKRFPFTYKALGAIRLDRMVNAGELPPYAEYYAIDADLEIEELKKKLKSGEIDGPQFQWAIGSPMSILRFREMWEITFKRILEARVDPPQKLRTNRNVWPEMRILAHLVGSFKVEYEPTNVIGMGSRHPDFLLGSPDGDVIFEVATIGTKPEDIREGVKVSSGGTTKKTLQNKLRKQFNGCEGDYTVPIVIAVQTNWDSDEFDFLNSLYGPLQFSFSSVKKSGELVEEGASRDVAKAFFYQPDVECISAVARIGPSNSQSDFLSGRLYRPIKIPRHPINPKLWIRLRDALFEPVPKQLISEMNNVPSITTQEAMMLVKHGVDDISFFAEGMIDFPDDLPMDRRRFEELRREAKRLAMIERTRRIEFLKSAQGVDLVPIHSRGIFTINQLIKHEMKPADVDEKTWTALRQEALSLNNQPSR